MQSSTLSPGSKGSSRSYTHTHRRLLGLEPPPLSIRGIFGFGTNHGPSYNQPPSSKTKIRVNLNGQDQEKAGLKMTAPEGPIFFN